MSKEMEILQKQAVKAVSIYSLVIILGGLFLSALVQGVMVHLAGRPFEGTVLFFVSLGSLASSLYVFTKGKAILSSYG